MKYRLPWAVTALLLGLCGCTPAVPPPKAQFHAVTETAAPLDTTPGDIAILNRVSWGTQTADAQVLARDGVPAWLEKQLSPAADDGLLPDAAAQIGAMDITRKSVVQIAAEVRALQQAAQKSKGSPDFDANRKAYQQK